MRSLSCTGLTSLMLSVISLEPFLTRDQLERSGFID